LGLPEEGLPRIGAVDLNHDPVDARHFQGGAEAAIAEMQIPAVIAAVLDLSNFAAEPMEDLAERSRGRTAGLLIVVINVVVGQFAGEHHAGAKGRILIARSRPG